MASHLSGKSFQHNLFRLGGAVTTDIPMPVDRIAFTALVDGPKPPAPVLRKLPSTGNATRGINKE